MRQLKTTTGELDQIVFVDYYEHDDCIYIDAVWMPESETNIFKALTIGQVQKLEEECKTHHEQWLKDQAAEAAISQFESQKDEGKS